MVLTIFLVKKEFMNRKDCLKNIKILERLSKNIR